jgi:hypothetical protein
MCGEPTLPRVAWLFMVSIQTAPNFGAIMDGLKKRLKGKL